MKVLTFYSYKGGQGRTTAVANLGSCLYRLGYNVVLLDFDIESPGLPAKFGRSVFDDQEIKMNGGVVDYLLDSYGKMRPLQFIENRSILIDENHEGDRHFTLKLIPTGFVGKDKSYFQSCSSTGWKHLSSLTEDGPDKIRFFDGMLDSIRQMTPKPDYVLVDISSGNTAFGRVALTALAETVFCFFGPDPENIDGMRYVTNELKEIPRLRKQLKLSRKPLNIIPLLCRIPPFLHKDELTRIRQKASERLYPNQNADVYLLHSDADLEREWQLRIPPKGDVHNVQLTRDYLSVIAGAWGYLAKEKKTARLDLKDLLTALGLPNEINEQYRVFRLEHTQGVMINLSDSERNVSFKVKTFCAMLNDIHRGLVEDAGPKKLVDEKTFGRIRAATEREFYQAGRAPGAGFGQSLMKHVWESQDHMTDTEKLNEWCKFDSSVGFGNMSSAEIKLDARNHVTQGVIVVAHNFLAEERSPKEANLCMLLSGYIRGVTEKILLSSVRVDHPTDRCMRMQHARESCEFPFSVSPNRRNSRATEKKWPAGIKNEVEN
jgi:predicted hydrocarbon binding protein